MNETISLIRPLADSFVGGGFKEIYTLADGKPYEHPGVDLLHNSGATQGKPLVACAAGKVTIHRPGDGWGDGSFGWCCVIDHPDTPFWTIVAHMQADALAVASGQEVQQGQLLGYVGLTGTTTGYHCHWGMERGGGGGFSPARYNDAGVMRIGNLNLLDPLLYVGGGVIVPPPAPPTMPQVDPEINRALQQRFKLERLANDSDLGRVDRAVAILEREGVI